LLVVLDGADRLVAPATRAISAWSRASADARWIVTSRVPLGVAGEAVLELEPLPLPAPGGQPDAADAVQLYLERARATRFVDALGDGGAAEVAELVRVLDGNALAIEIAAAAARALPPARLTRHLARHPDAREAPAHAVIEAAVDTLELWERDAFAQCSVFAGAFDVDAAERVVDLTAHAGERDVRTALSTLCERGLLASPATRTRGAEPRYAMATLVRDYARDRLIAEGARDAAVRRHAQHYVELGSELAALAGGAQGARALAHLALETDNLLAVHRHALARAATRERAEIALEAVLAIDPLLAVIGPSSLRLALLDAALAAARRAGAAATLQVRALQAYADASRSLARRESAPSVAKAEPPRAPLVDDAPDDTLVVCLHGRWFRAPGGQQVPIDRWRTLQLLVEKLAAQRDAAPGEPLGVDALVAAGWPGERMIAKAGATRVYTAMSTLRRLGLRDVLVRVEGGYLFDPSVPIRRMGEP
jgi:predicted ATPase